jgi:dipeptidyl aminopeptidase/acylaminoacyl peptidase
MSGPIGGSVVRMYGGKVWLQGSESFDNPLEKAPRPFLKEAVIGGGDPKIVWQSAEDLYEALGDIVSPDASKIVVNRQSPTQHPDDWLVTVATGEATKLTNNRDYTPEMTATIKDRFRVTRPDGFSFWVNVTLPSTWTKGEKLPAFFWFYPSEYTDQAAYDRGDRAYNKNRWVNYGTQSKEYLTQLGYAVVAPDCPIVGKEGMMNNNYAHDLRQNLATVINECEKRGMIDREKLGIGGHSYGAFSTANAMVHTPFFKAGIAGDGNYNRTLTPMRFQRENRVLMDAREVYIDMSPILHADHMTGALLMYHGMADQNVGTHPIHSKNMYHMLESIGKDAVLYMYPHEDHGQRAQETVLDMWSRWVAWLDLHVKGNKAEPATAEKKEGGQ